MRHTGFRWTVSTIATVAFATTSSAWGQDRPLERVAVSAVPIQGQVPTATTDVDGPSADLGERAPGATDAPPRTAPPDAYTPIPTYPWNPYPAPYHYAPMAPPYGPYPYGGGYDPRYRHLGSRHHLRHEVGLGRETERWRQDALEARRAVEARKRQRIETGKDKVVERPGPYPYNPVPIDASEYPHPPGYGVPYGGAYGQGYAPYPYHHYSYGTRFESYRTEALAAREELTLMAYEDLLTQGLQHFRAGQYGAAARGFIAAAEKHQGDAGSRIHAAQALVAVGLYDEAIVHVRRAVSLKPLLLYTNINLQADYGVKSDFHKHVTALEEACQNDSDDTDKWLLLAWEHFFSPHPERSLAALRMVQRVVPHDRLAERLTRAAKPIIAEHR